MFLYLTDSVNVQSDPNQWIIKTIFVVIFAIIAFLIVVPGRGSRGQAIQRLTWLFMIFTGVIAIIFLGITTDVANAVGIGRGTDLLFYLLIIFFIGHVLLSSRRQTQAERDITNLARKIALLEATTKDTESK